MPDGARIRLPYRFKPRQYQRPFLKAFDQGYRRLVIPWHRRSGKEKTCVNLVAREMLKVVGTYYYFFPTYAQGKKALWQGVDKDGMPFMDHFPAELVQQRNETEMSITYKNGSRFQIVGSDNIDSLLSTNPVGMVFAEYSLQDPRAWQFMMPILVENGGWAVFDFTPRGHNHAYDLVEMARANPDVWYLQILTVDDTRRDDGTYVISPEAIEQLRREGVEEELIQQEYYCSFAGAHSGTPFTRELELARKQGRICACPYDPDFKVDSWWDIGIGDATSIWLTQDVGREVHVIEAFEGSGGGLDWAIFELKKRSTELGYVYGKHTGPHDLKNREWTNPRSRIQIAAGKGIQFETMPDLSLVDGIDAARRFIRRCVFDERGTKDGRNALGSYHYDWDERTKQYGKVPVHDWSSHFADAWRTLGVSHKVTQIQRSEDEQALRERIQISSSDTQNYADNGDWMSA